MGKKSKKHKGHKRVHGQEVSGKAVAMPKVISWPERLALPLVIIFSMMMFGVHLAKMRTNYEKPMVTFDESVFTRLGFQLKNDMPYNALAIVQDNLRMGRKLPKYLDKPLYLHPPYFAWSINVAYANLPPKGAYAFGELYKYASKVPNLMGSLCIILIFLFGRRLFDYRIGLVAAVLMALDLNFYSCSEKMWIASTLLFWVWLTLYLLHKATDNYVYFYAAGVTAGIALLSKYTAVLIFIIFPFYALFYHRNVFKQIHVYLSLCVTGLVVLPWILANYKVYGSDALNKIIFEQHNSNDFFIILGCAAAILLGGVAIVIKNRKRLGEYKDTIKPCLPYVFVGAMALFFLVIGINKDFWISVGRSLSWSSMPRNGWDLYFFDGEPWYFYLKQLMEYTPFYILCYVAFFFVPFAQRSVKFCFIAFAWSVFAGIMWKNFQGRYIILMAPAAAMITAWFILLVIDRCLKRRDVSGYACLSVFGLVLVYFLAKTLHVLNVVGVHGNVAYY